MPVQESEHATHRRILGHRPIQTHTRTSRPSPPQTPAPGLPTQLTHSALFVCLASPVVLLQCPPLFSGHQIKPSQGVADAESSHKLRRRSACKAFHGMAGLGEVIRSPQPSEALSQRGIAVDPVLAWAATSR